LESLRRLDTNNPFIGARGTGKTMTFLELATAIDATEKLKIDAEKALNEAYNDFGKFKAKQFKELEEEEARVQKFRDALKAEETNLENLFAQLHGKLPNAPKPAPKPDPTGAELKALYQGGMKYRGNLG
jgi:DNA-binding protein H-NS